MFITTWHENTNCVRMKQKQIDRKRYNGTRINGYKFGMHSAKGSSQNFTNAWYSKTSSFHTRDSIHIFSEKLYHLYKC